MLHSVAAPVALVLLRQEGSPVLVRSSLEAQLFLASGEFLLSCSCFADGRF